MYKIDTVSIENNFWPVGENVIITWKDSRSDWHNYIFLGIDVNSEWVFLTGRDQENDEFLGNPFYVRLKDIDTIEVEQEIVEDSQ